MSTTWMPSFQASVVDGQDVPATEREDMSHARFLERPRHENARR
jgi:hypothetical protein